MRYQRNMSLVKVKGFESLRRDTSSGAIVNTNRSAYLLAKKKVADATKHKDQMRMAVREINNLKSEMHEIKDMLKKVIEKNGN